MLNDIILLAKTLILLINIEKCVKISKIEKKLPTSFEKLSKVKKGLNLFLITFKMSWSN